MYVSPKQIIHNNKIHEANASTNLFPPALNPFRIAQTTCSHRIRRISLVPCPPQPKMQRFARLLMQWMCAYRSTSVMEKFSPTAATTQGTDTHTHTHHVHIRTIQYLLRFFPLDIWRCRCCCARTTTADVAIVSLSSHSPVVSWLLIVSLIRECFMPFECAVCDTQSPQNGHLSNDIPIKSMNYSIQLCAHRFRAFRCPHSNCHCFIAESTRREHFFCAITTLWAWGR